MTKREASTNGTTHRFMWAEAVEPVGRVDLRFEVQEPLCAKDWNEVLCVVKLRLPQPWRRRSHSSPISV
jgi:hypothetical protein